MHELTTSRNSKTRMGTSFPNKNLNFHSTMMTTASRGAYEGTGVWYNDWVIKKAAIRCSCAPKTVGYVNILNIQLVAEKKLKEEKAKTPKMRSKKSLTFRQSHMMTMMIVMIILIMTSHSILIQVCTVKMANRSLTSPLERVLSLVRNRNTIRNMILKI
jgi:hypothetical protein